MGQILPERNIAEEPHAGVGGDAVIDLGDGLYLLMVGRYAIAHQSVRRRQMVYDVDGHLDVGLPQQSLSGIES